MSEMLRELYQQVILDHNKNPQNFRKPEHASHSVEGYNPLCGDHYTIYLEMEGDTVKDVGFEGSGCAISKSSASVMTAAIKGRSKAEVEALFESFARMVRGELQREEAEALGKLAVFQGVREFPTRTKCATLSWHAMVGALRGEGSAVSTEVASEV